MAEPISIAITATLLPIVLAGIQSGLQLALEAMPEIHDARNKHAMKKLSALFFKAKMGELTEKGKNLHSLGILLARPNIYTCVDFEQAKRYYGKIEAYALLSENQTLLDHLEKVLQLMEGTLVVKDLMEKNHPIDLSDIDILHSKIQSWDMANAMVDMFKKHDLPPYEAVSNSPGLIKDPAPLPSEKKSANGKAWGKPAMWCLVAVAPPLLFVPKIRQKC